jgi:hypothetical protein
LNYWGTTSLTTYARILAGRFFDMPVGKDKIRPAWPIDITTEELFREFVVKKHGIYAKGMFGEEANKAYLSYMRPFLKLRGIHRSSFQNQEAHTHAHDANVEKSRGQLRAQELRNRIVSLLINRKGIEPSQTAQESKSQQKTRVGLHMLKEAIVTVEGVRDQRAINSRLTLLESGGLIKNPDPQYKIYEILIGNSSDSMVNGHMAGPPRGVTG